MPEVPFALMDPPWIPTLDTDDVLLALQPPEPMPAPGDPPVAAMIPPTIEITSTCDFPGMSSSPLGSFVIAWPAPMPAAPPRDVAMMTPLVMDSLPTEACAE
jgi:hypothetical protein